MIGKRGRKKGKGVLKKFGNSLSVGRGMRGRKKEEKKASPTLKRVSQK